MSVAYWLPPFLTEYARLLALKLRHRRCQIRTHRIAGDVELGEGCALARDVEVARGVRIGAYSYVNAGTLIGSGTIGKFCSIGDGCRIGAPQHPVDFLSTSPLLYGSRNVFGAPRAWEDFARPPVIGNDVWVGSLAVILQGVTVGDGAVVAASAVVTKDVGPYEIVAGVPARRVRRRFEEETIAHLLRWRWWDLPVHELRKHMPLFRGPFAGLAAAAGLAEVTAR